jgi:OmpA-OmpF porin, OOP family
MKYISKAIRNTALLTACSLAAAAQSSMDYLRAADRFFKEGDYYSASQYYEKYLTGKPGSMKPSYNPYVVQRASKAATATNAPTPSSRKDVVYNLAESYRMIHYYSKAEPYYREAANMGPVNPLAPYWHAKCQRAMGNLDSAEMEFKTFQAAYTTQDEVAKDVQKELENLTFIKAQKNRTDLSRYVVAKGDNPLNGTGASYAPFYLNDGTLSFTSTRPEGDSTTTVAPAKGTGKNPYTNKLYKASTSSTIGADVQKIDLPLDGKMEQGVAAFTPDGNKLFVTKWVMQGNRKMAALYSSTKNSDGSWSEPAKLPSTINANGASTQQPFVTADGRYLLFATDRSGGQGKMDLWYVALSSSFEPSAEVMNMGTAINTDGDDEAPFYHQPSKTLVYATNGKVGMGGYDLFYSKGDFTTWETPANMGQPVNSVKDDIYYASSDKASIFNNAFLSSDRDSPCCLELYSFNRKNLPKTIVGTVVDCNGNKPLPGASVSITDASGKTLASKTTDANGRYTLTLEEYQALKVNGTAEGYRGNAISVNTPATDADQYTNPQLCLTLVEKPTNPSNPVGEETLVFDNALFGFDKANLTEPSKTLLDRVVDRLKQNPKMTIQIESHTDNFGSDEYNQTLSEKRAQACADYLVEKGIDSGRLTTKGYGESQPVAPNMVNGKDNPEGRAKNRRTEFKIMNR